MDLSNSLSLSSIRRNPYAGVDDADALAYAIAARLPRDWALKANTLVKAYKAAGAWTKTLILGLGHNYSIDAALVDVKNPARTFTATNCTFAASGGVSSIASTAYIDLGVTAAQAGLTQNACGGLIWADTGSTTGDSNARLLGSVGGGNFYIQPRTTGGAVAGLLFSASAGFDAVATPLGITHLARLSSTQCEASRDGVALTPVSVASEASTSTGNLSVGRNGAGYRSFRFKAWQVDTGMTESERAAVAAALTAYAA